MAAYPDGMADDLQPWTDALIAPVLPADAACHSIHSYFNADPLSPDGTLVLFYRSTAADAGSGELCVSRGDSGPPRVLARIRQVEDAHRAACQQWSDGGRSVAFHDLRNGRWQVLAVDLADGRERVLAVDRQLGFGSPADHRVPVYGRHWNPGPHRDLELADVRDGSLSVAVRVSTVATAHADWVQREFGGPDGLSVFFPVISPDGRRVFFKLARGRGGDDFRGMDASRRQGKAVCELASGRLLRLFPAWGHPSWAPDGEAICEKGQELHSIADGSLRRLAPPGSPSDHPSLSPDGRLWVTDAHLVHHGGRRGEWGIVVGSVASGRHVIVHRFANQGGAASWRPAHPHPVFAADGRSIRFNVNDGAWTRLHAAWRR